MVGIRHEGRVTEYARADELTAGTLGEHSIAFREPDLVTGDTPLSTVFDRLSQNARVFVVTLDSICGIVTRADMQKAPVRMWLFGLISLLEMQMLRIIREFYPANSWTDSLSSCRLEKATYVFKDRKNRNEEIDLADCLQFCDKRDLILGRDEIVDGLNFSSKNALRKLLKELEDLRNELAHAQDFVAGDWPSRAHLVQNGVKLLDTAEGVSVSQ